MAYTYKYPRPAVTADCVVMTKAPLAPEASAEGLIEGKDMAECLLPTEVLVMARLREQ